jgi:GNAT superfamily N-acetyltransferase
MSIVRATSVDDYAAFGVLVREYVDWCRARYQHDAWFVDQALSHQSLDQELGQLAVTYGPPNGSTFLARDGETVCGCGAYHRMSDEVCEMKRVFVPERFRGKGYGRALCAEIIRSARAEQFKIMRLDTANLLVEAIGLYESFGFKRRSPYQSYPPKLMPYIVFMEMPLEAA